MVIRRLVRGACLAPAVVFFAVALTPSPALGDTTDELFRLSGLENQLGSVSAVVEQGIEAQGGGSLDPALLNSLLRAMRTAYAPHTLRDIAITRLREEHDPRHAAAALEWLRSPLGRMITAMEEAAATPEGDRAADEHARNRKARLSAERADLIQRLDAATSVGEFALYYAMGVSHAVARGLNAASDHPLDGITLREAVESQREMLKSIVYQMTTESLSYTYRDLSDSSFLEYIGFLESESGVWYVQATLAAVGDTLLAAEELLAAALTEELHSEQRKQQRL